MQLSGQERHLSRPDRPVVDHASRFQQQPTHSQSHRKKIQRGTDYGSICGSHAVQVVLLIGLALVFSGAHFPHWNGD